MTGREQLLEDDRRGQGLFETTVEVRGGVVTGYEHDARGAGWAWPG